MGRRTDEWRHQNKSSSSCVKRFWHRHTCTIYLWTPDKITVIIFAKFSLANRSCCSNIIAGVIRWRISTLCRPRAKLAAAFHIFVCFKYVSLTYQGEFWIIFLLLKRNLSHATRLYVERAATLSAFMYLLLVWSHKDISRASLFWETRLDRARSFQRS